MTKPVTITLEAIDDALADLGGQCAILQRDQRELSRGIADLEASIARAVASGAPSDGIAEGHQELRGLKGERAGMSMESPR